MQRFDEKPKVAHIPGNIFKSLDCISVYSSHDGSNESRTKLSISNNRMFVSLLTKKTENNDFGF